MFQMPNSQIGGAIVRRTFNSAGRQVFSGQKLSREEVLKMPLANRNALADKRYIDIFPISDAAAAANGGERFVVCIGKDQYVVLEGRQITDEPVDRETAYALAGKEPPAEAKPKRKKEPKQ